MRGNNMQLHDRQTHSNRGRVRAQVEDRHALAAQRGTGNELTGERGQGPLSQNIYGLTFAVNVSRKFMATAVAAVVPYWSEREHLPAATPVQKLSN